MKQIFDYRCPKGHVKEQFVERGTPVRCDCGLMSYRIISPVAFKLEGVTGHFPTAADKWTREHERRGGVTSE